MPKFTILHIEMTLALVAMDIATKLLHYDASVSFLSWAKFHDSMSNINGSINNSIMDRSANMK